jgi:hypothetical protein
MEFILFPPGSTIGGKYYETLMRGSTTGNIQIGTTNNQRRTCCAPNALEEVQRDFHPVAFTAAFIAAEVADIVAWLIAGSDPVSTIPSYPSPLNAALPFYALFGCLSVPLGVLFNRGLIAALNVFSGLKGNRR